MRYITLLIMVLVSPSVLGHGGGLDAYGCHHNRKTGGYHCHRGQLAGQYFQSKPHMLQVLEGNIVQRRQQELVDEPKGTAVHEGEVVGVTDGDTLTLLENQRQIKIRLAEIDTPERGQPYGTQAKKVLSDLVFGKHARAVVQDIDRYGRSVARIYVNGIDVNAEMVKRGAAWVYRRYAEDTSLYDLEHEAQANKRGLWGLPEAQQIPPWEWRHR